MRRLPLKRIYLCTRIVHITEFGLTSKFGHDLVQLYELFTECTVNVASQDGRGFKIIVGTLVFECLDADDVDVLCEKQLCEDF